MAFKCDDIVVGAHSKALERLTKTKKRAGPQHSDGSDDEFTAKNIHYIDEGAKRSKIVDINRKHKKNPGRLIKSIKKLKGEQPEDADELLFETALARIRGHRVVDDEKVVTNLVKKHKSKLRKNKRKSAEKRRTNAKKQERQERQTKMKSRRGTKVHKAKRTADTEKPRKKAKKGRDSRK